MTKIRTMFASLIAMTAPAAFAHSGHPTFSPHHTHGVLDLNPVALLVLAAIAVGVMLAGRGASRPRARFSRNKK